MKKLFSLLTFALLVNVSINAQIANQSDYRSDLNARRDSLISNTFENLWNKFKATQPTYNVGIGLRWLPTKSGEIELVYIDDSPSADRLAGTFMLENSKTPLAYEIGIKDGFIKGLGFGIDGYFGKDAYAVNFYAEYMYDLASMNDLELGGRVSFGGARWVLGKVPRNGSYYLINGNKYTSNKDLTIKYRDNVATISPSIKKTFSISDSQGIYLRANVNLGIKMSPNVELSGETTSGDFFSEQVKLSDPSVSFTYENESSDRAPVSYSGFTVGVGFTWK